MKIHCHKNKKTARNNQTGENKEEPTVNETELQETKVSPKLQDNLNFLQRLVGPNNDIVFRSFSLGTKGKQALVVYIENMVDKNMLQSQILKPLMYDSLQTTVKTTDKGLNDLMLNSMLTVSNVTEARLMDQVSAAILSGGVVLIVDGLDKAFIIDIRSHDKRSISEPGTEIVVRGPREGFTETLETNIVLIRRKVKSPNLTFESLDIGRVTATKVSIVYIKDIASPDLLLELKRRLERIEIDGILESGYLEEFIEDNPYSPFPQIIHTERPDRVAGCLLEGRIAIITDGTPHVLIIPVEITALLSSPEDYYERYLIGSVVRCLRYAAFIASILLPSFYIAIGSFHQEMIPTKLLISISNFRQGVPFSALGEALLMEITFEVLREAGTRLPRSVGQAVSIVGALVIGQAAVQAGLVSPIMVIIVAATGITSFTLPAYNLGLAMRLLRFPIMLLAATLGLFGIMFGIIILSIHLAKLRSFGLPYLSSLAILHPTNLKDVLIRAPWWAMDERPAGIIKRNLRRQAPHLKPSTPNSEPSKKGE